MVGDAVVGETRPAHVAQHDIKHVSPRVIRGVHRAVLPVLRRDHQARALTGLRAACSTGPPFHAYNGCLDAYNSCLQAYNGCLKAEESGGTAGR